MKKTQIDHIWWISLDQPWKDAFSEVFFGHKNEPNDEEFYRLWNSQAIRFAGPRAPYPNMSFELNNLSGIRALNNLEILVFTHQDVSEIYELAALPNLKSLFLYNNRIESLSGIEKLNRLEQLYVQFNKINSIEPIRELINLKELYVNDNAISFFEGLTEEHAENMEVFFAAPNEGLKQKEIIRVERELGIICKKY